MACLPADRQEASLSHHPLLMGGIIADQCFRSTSSGLSRIGSSKKKANKLWVWKARDRATGRIIDWELGGRDRATLERLLERLKRWGVRLYCTDDWAAYGKAIPQGRLFVGKEETHGIERDHSRQRHWLARFR